MSELEKNDPDTQYSDPPGTRALTKGVVALVGAMGLGLLALVLASLGLLPALLLLAVAVPLGVWGKNKLARNEPQLPPESAPTETQ